MSSSQDLQLTINRIYRALAHTRKPGYRDIRLGLDRVSRVVPDKQEWQGIHVAGTNGKGSICAFLAGFFKLAGIGYGSFNSPAFPDKHNAVVINGLYVNQRMYEMETSHVQAKWDRIAAGWKFQQGEDPPTLSPFELETATAFRVFNKMHVPYGIVEVGMGGATDATNAMKHKAITVISKIGLDHQEYLGKSIESIAKVKAGIMRKGVPCIVDHTNLPSVVRVLREHAREVGTSLILTWKAEPFLMSLDNNKWQLESYQIQNLLCAALAFRHLFPLKEINLDKLMALEPYQPGRLEQVDIEAEVAGTKARRILVDGAHNMLGVEGLADHVDKRLRKPDQPVTWVVGMSSSTVKPFDKMIERLVRPGDNLAFVEFAQGPNEPAPAPANFGSDLARAILKTPGQVYDGTPEIGSALKWACEKAGDGPVVVTGSLYLVRDLFKLDGVRRKRQLGTRRPGRAQLYRYTKLAQERKLTNEEAREFKQARRHWHLSPVRNPTFAAGEGQPAKDPNVAEHQRKAAYHKKKEDECRKSIATLRQGSDVDSSKLEDLEKHAAEHKALYDEAMFKVRGHEALAHKKYMSYRQIYGHPRKPRPQLKSPFITQGTAAPEAEGSRNQSTSQDAAEDAQPEQTQMLRKQMAAEKDKEGGDSFDATFTSQRRED